MSNLVIYRSSAGSGKTYTLVKEYLTLVLRSEQPFFYRKILAITFTNKAASELKERIIHQLMGLSKIDPQFFDQELLDAFVNELSLSEEVIQKRAGAIVQHILYNYGDLAVSTIDKFVVKILRYFNRELNLSADFAVELNTQQILAMSVERMMQRIGIDPVLTKMSLAFAQQKSEGDKSWKIEEDLNKIASLLKEEESQQAVEELEQLDENMLMEEFKITKKKVNELRGAIDEIGNKCREILSQNDDVAPFMTVNIVKFIKALGTQKQDNYFFPTDAAIRTLNGDRWWPNRNKKKIEITQVIDGIQSEMLPIITQAITLMPRLILSQLLLEAFAPLMFTKRINHEVEVLKKEQNLVLINDNNKLISSVVRDNPSPFIYEKLGERYQHFMIDEFQDTSVVQWHNLIPLVEESLGLGHRNILVGDSKQSIYRFRGGEMEQLAQLPKIHKAADYHNLTEVVFRNNLDEKNLGYNYRSKTEIVTFNNDLFEYILSQKDERMKSLYSSFKQIPNKGSGGQVKMTLIDKTNDEEMLEAVHRLILESKEAGFEYGDIAVLVYRNKIGRLIAEHCKKLGLPIVSNESLLLKNQSNINFIIELLKHLVAPEHVGHQHEIIIYLFDQVESDSTLHVFLKKYLASSSDFNQVFADYNFSFDPTMLMQKDVYSLCESLCKDFRMDSFEAYMLEFLNIASGFVRKEKGSISAFLDYWSLNEDKFALQLSESSKAINILSVHKSKGLEFPVVINPYYFKQFKKHSRKFIWIDDEKEEDNHVQLIPVKDAVGHTPYEYLIEEEVYKTSVDRLNALYVATTRAKNALHIILPEPSKTAQSSNPTRLDVLMLKFANQRMSNYNGEAVWGDELIIEKKEKGQKESPQFLFEYTRMNWHKELRIAISDEQKGEELTFGNRLHELIAETNSKDEIASVLDNFKQKNFLEDDSFQKIQDSLSAVFNIDEFAQWHQQSKEVLNEKEILHANGKILRPDRIFMMKDEVIVVDFKTGIERKSHPKQVKEYAEALIEMGYKNTSGYLLYTQNQELKKVV